MNGLKEANDEHGHAAGDDMLRRVGEVLTKAVDAPACAARVGGDEFMVLLPASDERGAEAVKERILSLLELNNQFYPGQLVSLSMGVACCNEGSQLEATVSRADQAMYAEKARYYKEKCWTAARAGIDAAGSRSSGLQASEACRPISGQR